jgi:hypothetical protein
MRSLMTPVNGLIKTVMDLAITKQELRQTHSQPMVLNGLIKTAMATVTTQLETPLMPSLLTPPNGWMVTLMALAITPWVTTAINA